MKRRLLFTGWLSLVLLVGVSASVLAATVSTNTLSKRTKGKAGGMEGGFVKQETWLEEEEGDRGSASLLAKVNKTTFVVPAAPLGGEEPGLDGDDAGLVHCFGKGANSCEFVKTGPLEDISRPLVVNDKVVVVQGVGANKSDCEKFGTKDDTLMAVWRLGTRYAKMTTIASNLCLFTHATNPIRLNDDCIGFIQLNTEIRVVCGLRDHPWAPDMTTLNVNTLLGVFVKGSGAGRGVRLSDTLSVWASPGADAHYANSGSNTDNDGLIILKLDPPSVSWLTIGRIPGNMNGRPTAVNHSAAVVMDVGDDGEEPGGEFGLSIPNDNKIHVVERLNTGSPTITTYSGFGYVRRPLRLNKGAVVAFEEEGGGHEFRSDVVLRAHVIRGIWGHDWTDLGDSSCHHFFGQDLKSVTVSGGNYHAFEGEVDKTKKDNVGIVLNCNQAAFFTRNIADDADDGDDDPDSDPDSDAQAFLLTHTLTSLQLEPSTTPAGSMWDEIKAAKINDWTVVYTASVDPTMVNTKGLGVLKAGGDDFKDTRLTLPTGAQPPGGCLPTGNLRFSSWSEASSDHPVAVHHDKAVVLATGLDCRFGRSQSADDGLVFIEGLESGPFRTSFVKTGRSCAAPGCKPVYLGRSSPDLVVLAGPGLSSDLSESNTYNRCSLGTPTCPPGQTISCPTNSSSAACTGGGTPTCASGTPSCSGTRRDVAFCFSGGSPSDVQPSCSGSTLTCSSGTPVCPAGFTNQCPGTPNCKPKDDDTLTVVSFPDN